MNSDTVMALPISNSNAIKEAIATNQIKRFAGLLDEKQTQDKVKKAQALKAERTRVEKNW